MILIFFALQLLCVNCWTLLSCEGSEDTAMGPAEWLDLVWGGCHAGTLPLSWWYDKCAWIVYCIITTCRIYRTLIWNIWHMRERERCLCLSAQESQVVFWSEHIRIPSLFAVIFLHFMQFVSYISLLAASAHRRINRHLDEQKCLRRWQPSSVFLPQCVTCKFNNS